MADTLTLHQAVLDRLRAAAPALAVYDSTVPDNLPSDGSGAVYPYVVVWDSPGSFPASDAESLGSTDDDRDGVLWTCRATVAAGRVDWLRSATRAARGALLGFRISRLASRLSDEGTDPVVAKDPDVTPVRYYVPLVFTMRAP